jgi:hypothetical protein
VIVGGEGSSSETEESDSGVGGDRRSRKALVSASMAQLINSVGHGSLGTLFTILSIIENQLSLTTTQYEHSQGSSSTYLQHRSQPY